MSKKTKALQDHEFSVITGAEFTQSLAGDLKKGTEFKLADVDPLCITVTDDDKFLNLSGNHDDDDDDANQTAVVEGIGDVGAVETGLLVRFRSSDNKKYDMVQLVTESGDTFWTFAGGIPPGDETLTVKHVFDHKKVKYDKGLGIQVVNAADDSLTTDEDTATTGNLLENDCIGATFKSSHDDDDDDDGGIQKSDLKILSVDGGTVGTAFTVTSAGGRQALVTIAADGTITVDPDGNFDALAVGQSDTIAVDYTVGATHTVGKGKKAEQVLETDEATASILVTGVNDAPVAADDSYDGAGPLDVDAANGVLSNDTDIDIGDALTASLVSGPANGTLELRPDGSFTYVASSLFSGSVQFTYQATDPHDASSTATVTIEVPEAAPTEAESYTVDEDNRLTASVATGVLANDSVNPGDTLKASLITGPEHGTLVLNEDGSFTYDPDADFNGADAFFYLVTDSAGETRESLAEITINSVNDAPIFDFSTFQGAPLVGRFSVGQTVARIEAFDIDGDTLFFRLENKTPGTNDAVLFDLVTVPLSDGRFEVDVFTSALFPQTDADLRDAAGDDNRLEVRLFVSDGFEEAFIDLGPGSLTAG